MNPNSRQAIHIGINSVFVPPAVFDAHTALAFQGNLGKEGIDFTNFEQTERSFTVVRQSHPILNVQVATFPAAPVGQLVITCPDAGCNREVFEKEAEAIVKAFERTWPQAAKQVLASDATLRELYDAAEPHAFEEIWVKWLGRREEDLRSFGLVVGGGLRLVIPPTEPQNVLADIKFESFMQDSRKLFVEANFQWAKPQSAGTHMTPKSRLQEADHYITEKVIPFMTKGATSDNP
jgi:hypothetical protein